MDRALVRKLLDDAGATRNRDVLGDILRSAYGLATDDAERLDLKITRDSLREMRDALRLSAPYERVRKVTVFGSARTLRTDPLYEHARELARRLARNGWVGRHPPRPGGLGRDPAGARAQ